jgi:glycerol-3-phosphate O-acyltransferase/dihydroxyacetone phosphate acyltransferase
MLYRIFYFLFRLTVKGYFRSIYLQGKEHIPAEGPVIFTPNHTSAFMDPILLATEIDRSLYFLARGDMFRKKFVAPILHAVHMLPIYRKDESPDDFHKNQQIFEKCFSHLSSGGAIMVFPEGLSKTERRLRPIKTGTARIALGAEELHDFNLDVKIVPVGINYSNPHHFRSDVFINFGEAITSKDYKAAYQTDSWQTVLDLTEAIKTRLEEVVVVIEDERLDRIIRQIEILYRSKLRAESEPGDKAPKDFYLSKDIVKAVEFHLKRDPKRLEDFEVRIDAYLKGLKKLGIRDTQVRSTRITFNLFWSIVYFSLGFPLFLYGFVFNYIPFKLADQVVKRFNIREDFVGSIRMAGGMFIFLLSYIIQASIVGFFTSFWWALLFIVSLYPAGMFTISYLKHYYQLRGTFKYLSLFMRKSDLIARIKVTRSELVDELERGRLEYLKATASTKP